MCVFKRFHSWITWIDQLMNYCEITLVYMSQQGFYRIKFSQTLWSNLADHNPRIIVWDFLVWSVTLTTSDQWQRARELGQPIRGVRQICMSFLPRLALPAACFVCLRKQTDRELDTNCTDFSSVLSAHEDSGDRRGLPEPDRTGAPPVRDESLTRRFLPGDRERTTAAHPSLLPQPTRPWPWWLCSGLPPPVQQARPTAARGRWVEEGAAGAGASFLGKKKKTKKKKNAPAGK